MRSCWRGLIGIVTCFGLAACSPADRPDGSPADRFSAGKADEADAFQHIPVELRCGSTIDSKEFSTYQPAEPDGPRPGVFHGLDSAHSYSFPGQAGQRYTFKLERVSGLMTDGQSLGMLVYVFDATDGARLTERLRPYGSEATAALENSVDRKLIVSVATRTREATGEYRLTVGCETRSEIQQPNGQEDPPPDGKYLFDRSCAACHATGVAGAPKLGDSARWADLNAQGQDVQYRHAIHGYQGWFGVMPPKGGFLNMSDDAVRAVVDYLVRVSGGP